MKALKPTHKENKRYLLLKGERLKKNVFLAIKEYVGILGMAEASPNWISIKKNKGVLSINRKSLEKVRASFVIFSEKIEVLQVSGTLKKIK